VDVHLIGPKRDNVTGGWRKLHNVKLHNLHSSENIRVIKVDEKVTAFNRREREKKISIIFAENVKIRYLLDD
jgi:hypothetical protein